ncbi:hypothetical protein [Streptomyces sp. NPDC096153]|uniref:hypothetical protein n=1 Tax=Streptomyces sp. NPDC096153 TaxID=3155548 RepID=UPI0033309E78
MPVSRRTYDELAARYEDVLDERDRYRRERDDSRALAKEQASQLGSLRDRLANPQKTVQILTPDELTTSQRLHLAERRATSLAVRVTELQTANEALTREAYERTHGKRLPPAIAPANGTPEVKA